MGASEEIAKEIALYETLRSHSVPLPRLLGYEAPTDDIGRMKEESLQWKLYAELFTDSYEANWHIDDALFAEFIDYQYRHLSAQKNTIDQKDIVADTFPKYTFLYEEWVIPSATIDVLLERIEHDTAALPQGWNHGDHNAYNIFNDGLIDLEDSFYGPLGYDTITAITQNFWFPSSDAELTKQHTFSPEQITRYLDDLSVHPLAIDFTDSRIFGALFLMRGIFVTVQSGATPMLEKYRYAKLQHAMEAYLAGVDMIAYCIEHY